MGMFMVAKIVLVIALFAVTLATLGFSIVTLITVIQVQDKLDEQSTTNPTPGCSSAVWKEGKLVYTPGYPKAAATPRDFALNVAAGEKVEVEIHDLEANSCCDRLVITEGKLDGALIANLTGKIVGAKYTTNSSSTMIVSWQPKGAGNVRGMMVRVRNPIPPSLQFTDSPTGRVDERVCELNRRMRRSKRNLPSPPDKKMSSEPNSPETPEKVPPVSQPVTVSTETNPGPSFTSTSNMSAPPVEVLGCVLSHASDLRNYQKGVGICSGVLISLAEVDKVSSTTLYGCRSVTDLLLLRGGRIVDWSIPSEAQVMESASVCTRHYSSLILNWKKNRFGMKTNNHGRLVCSIHKKKKKKALPMTNVRIQKDDAIFYMTRIGALCHVGAPVCQTHFEAMRTGDVSAFEHGERKESKVSGLNEELRSESPMHFDFVDESSDDPLYVLPPTIRATTPQPDTREEDRIRALRSVLADFKITRLTSEKSWSDLEADTKRKKIQSILSFLDELFKVAAGEHWETMKAEFLTKVRVAEPDPRIDSIMDAIGSCLEDTSDKAVRISVLKIVTGLFTEKEICTSTGASRYLVRQAKLYDFDELRQVSSFRREKYDKQKVELFMRFLARPEILLSLPHACKLLKLDNGTALSIASMARAYGYREIYRLFGRHCEEIGRSQGLVSASDIAEFVRCHSIGFSTAYKLMEVIAPVRKIRMTCVDAFQASAYEACDELSRIIEELSILGEISSRSASDLTRRHRVSKSFLFGEMRLHIVEKSNVLNHCWTHALSDPKDRRFAKACDHEHDSSCKECTEALLLPGILKKILKKPLEEAVKKKDPIRHRLARIHEILEESECLIQEFRDHVIRSVASEEDRRRVIDNLQDGHALIVADYAMKILPSESIEKQSNWFAKCGVSFHMSAVTARLNGEFFTHNFGHLSGISKQDSTAVAGILEHCLEHLKLNGVTHVHLRTDNAGTYHCIGLISTLYHMTDKLGITILSHIFSEPQFGKGSADRQISLCKGKLSRYVDSGHSACTPNEMFNGFLFNILLKGCSFYIIEVSSTATSTAVLRGVKKMSSFRFENSVGVLVRRHDAIGDGMMVTKSALKPILYAKTIHKEGGYTTGKEDFWKKLTTSDSDVDVPEAVPCDSTKTNERKDTLLCTDELCRSRFKTTGGLEEHLRLKKHSYYKATETITDFASKMFAELVETNQSAQLAVRQDSIVPLTSADRLEKRERGWALRKSERAATLNPDVKKEVERMVREDLDANRRAEARGIRDKLRHLKSEDGAYRFPLKKCLNEGQVKSQITRILNLKKKEGDESSDKGTESPDQQCSNAEEQQKKGPRGRGKRKSQEMMKAPEDKEKSPLTEEYFEEDVLDMMNEAVANSFDAIFEK